MSVLEFIVIALGATIVAVVAFWCLSPDFRRRIEVPKYRFRSRQQTMDGNAGRPESRRRDRSDS